MVLTARAVVNAMWLLILIVFIIATATFDKGEFSNHVILNEVSRRPMCENLTVFAEERCSSIAQHDSLVTLSIAPLFPTMVIFKKILDKNIVLCY